MRKSHGFKYLLFDIGGVFIELTGVSTMIEWSGNRYSVQELWNLWITSTSVRLFETGKIGADQFASMIIEEFRLTVDKKEFLRHFSSWSNQPFPGAIRLLEVLKSKYTIASLSNTNPIHWDILCNQIELHRYFHFNFPSHQIGRIKPDLETFGFVARALDASPKEILFFDDNGINVENAARCGLQSFVVRGVGELSATLEKLELL